MTTKMAARKSSMQNGQIGIPQRQTMGVGGLDCGRGQQVRYCCLVVAHEQQGKRFARVRRDIRLVTTP